MGRRLISLVSVCIFATTLQIARADLQAKPTAVQLRSDIRVLLKSIAFAEATQYGDTSLYSTSLTSLGIKVPSYLIPFGVVTLTASGAGVSPATFTATFEGNAAPIAGIKYSISQSGTLVGMTQYANAGELVSELQNLLAALYTAQVTYFSENNSYIADEQTLVAAGFQVPAYLKAFVTLSITTGTAGSSFVATFTGSRYPILGRRYTIDNNKTMTGF